MSFFQEAPRLGNQFDADRVLRRFLERTVPGDVRDEIEPSLRSMGEAAAGPLLDGLSRRV